jgi:hypothetical protein
LTGGVIHAVVRKRESLQQIAEIVARYRSGDLEGCANECRTELMLDPEDEVAKLYLRRCEEHDGAGTG